MHNNFVRQPILCLKSPLGVWGLAIQFVCKMLVIAHPSTAYNVEVLYYLWCSFHQTLRKVRHLFYYEQKFEFGLFARYTCRMR